MVIPVFNMEHSQEMSLLTVGAKYYVSVGPPPFFFAGVDDKFNHGAGANFSSTKFSKIAPKSALEFQNFLQERTMLLPLLKGIVLCYFLYIRRLLSMSPDVKVGAPTSLFQLY